MDRKTLAGLSSAEKDTLILALHEELARLRGQIGGSGDDPPKTPENSSIPPSRGQKSSKPVHERKPRRKRSGPGVTRRLADDPDQIIDCYADQCPCCGGTAPAEQSLRHEYDHIDVPPVKPVVTRVRLFGGRCENCQHPVKGTPPDGMAPGSPFGLTILALLIYLHHQDAISYQRLTRMMIELFGLTISEGAIANALRPKTRLGGVLDGRAGGRDPGRNPRRIGDLLR